jgi:GAF domain-containing protein
VAAFFIMLKPPLPDNETQRLAALLRCNILDTKAEQRFDDITLLATEICQVPIALVSLVGRDRQWFKSQVGIDVTETPRDLAFCAHAILSSEPLIVPDALADRRFKDNPLAVSEPHVRFYAGFPLITHDGFAIGTLCVIDHQPRYLSVEQVDRMKGLAVQVSQQLQETIVTTSAEQLAQKKRWIGSWQKIGLGLGLITGLVVMAGILVGQKTAETPTGKGSSEFRQ